MTPLQGLPIRGARRVAAFVPFLLSAPLLLALGPQPQVVGVCVGLFLLSLPFPAHGPARWMQRLAAIGAAVALGFRIPFLTDPGGGVLALGGFCIPFTLLWGTAVLGVREGLRLAAPRPALQLSIDLLLAVDALLLVFAFPQARAVPVARALPLLLLAIVLWGAVFARGRRLAIVHRSVAFGLVLFGIGGVTKGAVSLFLVAPLAMIGLPMMTASSAFLASGVVSARPLPRLLARLGISREGFVLSAVALVSAFALGGILAAYHSVIAGCSVLLVLPLLALAHWAAAHLPCGWRLEPVEARFGRIRVLGVGFDRVDLAAATARVERMLAEPARPRVIVTPNSLSVLRATRDPALFSAYMRADLVLPDGIGVVWASRWLRGPLSERVTGVDLAEAILPIAARSRIPIFLLGGRPGVAKRAGARLAERFPGLPIVGTRDGYFTDAGEIHRAIEVARPGLLFVGMGVPRQERFMMRHAEGTYGPVMIGLGGALDLFAGDRQRAPRAWRRLGLEWLYRIVQEPRRIGAAWAILQFILRATAARIRLALQELLALPAET